MLGGQLGRAASMRRAQLLAMADRQRGVYPHYFGVTMLNLAVTAILKTNPAAIELRQRSHRALEETSSRIELSAALMAKATALTMLGRGQSSARVEIERASELGSDRGSA